MRRINKLIIIGKAARALNLIIINLIRFVVKELLAALIVSFILCLKVDITILGTNLDNLKFS